MPIEVHHDHRLVVVEQHAGRMAPVLAALIGDDDLKVFPVVDVFLRYAETSVHFRDFLSDCTRSGSFIFSRKP